MAGEKTIEEKNVLKFDGQIVYFKSSEDMSEVATNSVDFVFTSPPYWMIKDYHHEHQIGREPYRQYIERLNKVWSECYRVVRDNGILAIDVGSKRHLGVYYPIGMDIYNSVTEWKLIDRLIWYIPNALPQPNHYLDKLFDNKYEDILIFAKNYEYNYTFNKIRVPQKYRSIDPRKYKMNPQGRSISNIIRVPAYRPPTIKQMNYHEAAFPEDLVYVMVHTFTNESDTILDPFVGSGTTLKVTKAMKRKGIGYEINHNLKELIKRRIVEPWEPRAFEAMDLLNGSTSKTDDEQTNIDNYLT